MHSHGDMCLGSMLPLPPGPENFPVPRWGICTPSPALSAAISCPAPPLPGALLPLPTPKFFLNATPCPTWVCRHHSPAPVSDLALPPTHTSQTHTYLCMAHSPACKYIPPRPAHPPVSLALALGSEMPPPRGLGPWLQPLLPPEGPLCSSLALSALLAGGGKSGYHHLPPPGLASRGGRDPASQAPRTTPTSRLNNFCSSVPRWREEGRRP